METKHIALYVRTATNSLKAIQAQLTALEEYTEELKASGQTLTLSLHLDIAARSSDTDRPGLTELIELVETGMVDLVLMTDITRISANQTDAMAIVTLLTDYGAVVEFTSQPDLLLEEGKPIGESLLDRVTKRQQEN
jgi:site-specific DNA recombinase